MGLTTVSAELIRSGANGLFPGVCPGLQLLNALLQPRIVSVMLRTTDAAILSVAGHLRAKSLLWSSFVIVEQTRLSAGDHGMVPCVLDRPDQRKGPELCL